MFEINFNGIIPLGYSTSVKVSGTHSVLSFNSEPFGKLSSLKSNVAILHFIVFDSSLHGFTDRRVKSTSALPTIRDGPTL